MNISRSPRTFALKATVLLCLVLAPAGHALATATDDPASSETPAVDPSPEPSPVEDEQEEGEQEEAPEPASRPRGALVTPSLSVDKTADADRDGTFSDMDMADAADESAEFQLVITNTDTVDVEITNVTDAYGSTTIDPVACLDSNGHNVISQTVPANGVVTCTFTIPEYSPPAGEFIDNTATVTAAELDDPASDTATVATVITGVSTTTLDVRARNDADGDGRFHKEETGSEGDPVSFRVVIANTGAAPVTIDGVTNTVGGRDTPVCKETFGSVVAAGRSAVCTFAFDAYVPPAGGRVINTVVVSGGDNGGGAVGGLVFARDRSVVRSHPTGGSGGSTGAALASTGFDEPNLLWAGTALLAVGSLLVRASRARGRHRA